MKKRGSFLAGLVLCSLIVTPLSAKSMRDAQSYSIAQTIVDNGYTTSLGRDVILVMWPQAWGTSSIEDSTKTKVQTELVDLLNTYSGCAVITDGTVESSLWDFFRITGVKDDAQQDKRDSITQKIQFAILPFIERPNGKYVLKLTVIDLATSERQKSISSAEYNTLSDLYSHPGACDSAVLALCEKMGIRLTGTERSALKEGFESLTAPQQQTILDARREGIENAISIMEDKADDTYDDEAQEFFITHILEKEILLASITKDEQALALAQQKAEAAEKKARERKEKENAPLTWEWGKDGLNGLYLDVGYVCDGPDLSLTMLFEILPWLSLGVDGGVLLLPGYGAHSIASRDYYDFNNPRWNGNEWVFDEHHSVSSTDYIPLIPSVYGRLQCGVSLHRFYFYAFGGAGAYMAIYGDNKDIGFSWEAGAGINVRFAHQHLSLGAFAKFRDYMDFGNVPSFGLSVGYNF